MLVTIAREVAGFATSDGAFYADEAISQGVFVASGDYTGPGSIIELINDPSF